MTRNQMALRRMVDTINRDGTTEETLKQATLLLISEVLYLSRELDRATSMANRAEQQSRRMVYYR